jgi:hypothetical protein
LYEAPIWDIALGNAFEMGNIATEYDLGPKNP